MATDGIGGRGLSKSAAAGWTAKTAQVIKALEATGDNTVYTLPAEERAAYKTLTLAVTEAIVAEGGNAEVLATMQGR